LFYRVILGSAIKKALMLGTFWKMGYKNRKWISLNIQKQNSDEKRKKYLDQIESKFVKS